MVRGKPYSYFPLEGITTSFLAITMVEVTTVKEKNDIGRETGLLSTFFSIYQVYTPVQSFTLYVLCIFIYAAFLLRAVKECTINISIQIWVTRQKFALWTEVVS